MSKDHDRLDGIFKKFQAAKNKDYGIAKRLFHEFKTGLERHIAWEEEMLFPLFENKTGMHNTGPTEVMRMEHKQIKEFLEGIHSKIAKKDMKTDEFEEGLIETLTPHNDKEENILYPMIDSHISEKEREEALKKMQNDKSQ